MGESCEKREREGEQGELPSREENIYSGPEKERRSSTGVVNAFQGLLASLKAVLTAGHTLK